TGALAGRPGCRPGGLSRIGCRTFGGSGLGGGGRRGHCCRGRGRCFYGRWFFGAGRGSCLVAGSGGAGRGRVGFVWLYGWISKDDTVVFFAKRGSRLGGQRW